jgi:hypothetical protein
VVQLVGMEIGTAYPNMGRAQEYLGARPQGQRSLDQADPAIVIEHNGLHEFTIGRRLSPGAPPKNLRTGATEEVDTEPFIAYRLQSDCFGDERHERGGEA